LYNQSEREKQVVVLKSSRVMFVMHSAVRMTLLVAVLDELIIVLDYLQPIRNIDNVDQLDRYIHRNDDPNRI
jgi:uncharacterized protein YjfI (DUF2170 family)